MRNISFTDKAWADYVWWQGQDRRTLKRINLLIEATKREPFTGIGKPGLTPVSRTVKCFEIETV